MSRRRHMNPAIREFVHCQSIAVVGASRSGKKFGNAAYQELRKRGYDVLAVHPSAETIEGDPSYHSLRDLPRRPDGVLISVPPGKVEPVLREAAEVGVRRVWLQQGAESPHAIAVANELGLSLASGACILMYMQPVRSFHGWHRGFMKLIGRLEPTDKVLPAAAQPFHSPHPPPDRLDLLSDEQVEEIHRSQVR